MRLRRCIKKSIIINNETINYKYRFLILCGSFRKYFKIVKKVILCKYYNTKKSPRYIKNTLVVKNLDK